MKVIFKIWRVKIYDVQFYFETLFSIPLNVLASCKTRQPEEFYKSFKSVLDEIHYFQHLQRNIYCNERKYCKWILQQTDKIFTASKYA